MYVCAFTIKSEVLLLFHFFFLFKNQFLRFEGIAPPWRIWSSGNDRLMSKQLNPDVYTALPSPLHLFSVLFGFQPFVVD